MSPCQEIRDVAPAAQHDACISALDIARQLPLALFDEIEFGLVVCDGQAHVRFANLAARQLLATTPLLVWHGGRLARGTQVSGQLDAGIEAAAERGRRCLVRLARGQDRLSVSVLPLVLPGESRQVLLMFSREGACSALGLELLASSYGLTLAERRVLSALLRECTPREIASEFGVAVSTIRTQIVSMRSKLGTRGIEGLLLRAAEMPPVASALRLARTAAPAGSCVAPQRAAA